MGKQKKNSSLLKRRKRSLLRVYLIFLLILILTVGIGLGVLVLEKWIPFRTVDIVIDPGHGDHDPGAVVSVRSHSGGQQISQMSGITAHLFF